MAKFPFAAKFQQQLLTLLCTDRKLLSLRGHQLLPEYFENKYHKKVFEFIIIFFRKYKEPPDKDTLLHLARQTALNPREENILVSTVNDIFSPMTKGQISWLKDQLKEFITHQQYKLALTEAIEAHGRKDYDSIPSAIRKAGKEILDSDDIGMNYFETLPDRLYDYSHEEQYRIPTLLHQLDIILRGGLGPGELGVILGVSGVGKSILLTNFEFAALVTGKTVFSYTLEMSELEKGRRMDSRMTGIPTSDLLDEDTKVDKKLQQIEKLRGKYFIKFFPTRQATVFDIRAHIDMMDTKFGLSPDLLCVDYGMIMKASRPRSEYRFELQDIHEELRGLAGELGVPLWCPAQTSKLAVDKEVITKEYIGECWGIVQAADIVLAICQTQEEERADEARLFLAKNRIEESYGVVDIKFEKGRMLVRDQSNLPQRKKKKKPKKEESEEEN